MATTTLGNKAIGDIVKLKVNGAAKEFIVVHKGKPSSIYDSSFDNGVILLMKGLYVSRAWHSSNVNDYAGSTIHSYLNSTFLGLFEKNIQDAIKQAKVPYRPGSGTSKTVNSGANGLSAKIFLLSGYEVGWTSSTDQLFPEDGAVLEYFKGTAATDAKRIGYLNGTATGWWLRSPSIGGPMFAWYVYTNGNCNVNSCSGLVGVRPALVLPSTLLVSDDGSVNNNTPPTISSASGASGVNLGTKAAAFTFTYTPNDADGDALTVTEYLDDVQQRQLTSQKAGTAINFGAVGDAASFQKITNGSHTLKIVVSDGKETATFTATFTKAVYEATITLKTPLAVAGDISAAVLGVVGSIPSDATYKVEATNNAKDSSPVWQDVTSEVKSGTNIVFSNKTAAKGAAFNFRITVKRGSSNTGGYITSVNGAFQ